ncbi:MAG: type I-U CRISPR-associated protein Csb2 [Candidatus Thermoplasmatota archaeon]|nr:type I-U CRISPR-associated protein Csb2 [Candidatus Thermoplasmatota archaeon]
MIGIRFRFPAGRYHATPWKRQVNEGVVEWPPNPWRIIRAFISVYYLKMEEDVRKEILISLIEKLSTEPIYKLPKASIGHTRHYMPQYKDKTSLIFDTFASVKKDDELIVSWPDIELNEEERNILMRILKNMNYLGRAESWVEAEIYDNPIYPNCMPLKIFDRDMDVELIDVLMPMKENKFHEWKVDLSSKMPAKSRKHLQNIDSMFNALCIDTSILKKNGWSDPPGSEWVQYVRPSNIFEITPAINYTKEDKFRPTVARFAIASQVPPRLTDTVSFADRIHKSLVSRVKDSRVFTGCDEEHKPLNGHEHSFILSESNIALGKGKRGEITHVSIYAPLGFGTNERKALDGLSKVWGHGGHDIQLVLIGIGTPSDYGGSIKISGQSPIMSESRIWESRTPFVPTRHPKYTRAGVPKYEEINVKVEGMPEGMIHLGSPEHDLLRLLNEMGFPKPVSIEKVEHTDLAGKKTRWLEFKRNRYGGNGIKSTEMGYGFRIVFPQSVRGPIVVGYGAHFGLGLFVPQDDKEKG